MLIWDDTFRTCIKPLFHRARLISITSNCSMVLRLSSIRRAHPATSDAVAASDVIFPSTSIRDKASGALDLGADS